MKQNLQKIFGVAHILSWVVDGFSSKILKQGCPDISLFFPGGLRPGHRSTHGGQPKRLLQQSQLSGRHRSETKEENFDRIDGEDRSGTRFQPEPEADQRGDPVCVGQPQHGEGGDPGLVLQ